MIKFACFCDNINEYIGRAVSWFVLFMVLVQFIVVLMRYLFGIGSITMQESIMYFHGALFMIAGGYTLLNNGHVRVDMFYRVASTTVKAWTDLLGTCFFLIPVCGLIIWAAWPDVAMSWRIGEGSSESSGLQYKYVLKSCLLAFPVLLLVQAFSTIIKAWHIIRGGNPQMLYKAE